MIFNWSEICVDFILCSLGPRSASNQLFLHVVDTALHLLSISSWPSWPVFKCFCRNVSLIIHVIDRNLKSIFSRSEQYNSCLRSTSIWFLLQNSANIFVRVVFYVILAFVWPIVIFRLFKLSNLRVGCYSCILYFWQTRISKIFFNKLVSS